MSSLRFLTFTFFVTILSACVAGAEAPTPGQKIAQGYAGYSGSAPQNTATQDSALAPATATSPLPSTTNAAPVAAAPTPPVAPTAPVPPTAAVPVTTPVAGTPVAPGIAAPPAQDPAKADPCAAFVANYDTYTICQDRQQKLQRMIDAKKLRDTPPPAPVAAKTVPVEKKGIRVEPIASQKPPETVPVKETTTTPK